MGGSERALAVVLRGLAGLLAVVALVGCGGPSYTMDAPSAFRRYAEADALRLITADGIRVAARTVDNEPVADLPFWVDAMKRHLDERGYALTSEQCFETQGGWDGCTLEFLLPYGAEDWVMSETVFVLGEKLLLIEATGPFERFAAVADDYKAALRTVRKE